MYGYILSGFTRALAILIINNIKTLVCPNEDGSRCIHSVSDKIKRLGLPRLSRGRSKEEEEEDIHNKDFEGHMPAGVGVLCSKEVSEENNIGM